VTRGQKRRWRDGGPGAQGDLCVGGCWRARDRGVC
jgi:hypothetical protein